MFGKFLVVDGVDGSGKATQTKRLVARLRRNGHRVKTIDFPQYYSNFFGKLIGEYLSGKFGKSSDISPYLISVVYAADRWESSKKIKEWLHDGNIVIADRYASSNQIHQGGKIKDIKKRTEFLNWLDEMEYKVFDIPRPDAIIYLDVPIVYSMKMASEKSAHSKKTYLNGKKDIYENDKLHMQNARSSAMDIVSKSNNWVRINCTDDKGMLSIPAIHNMIWKIVNKIINVK